jgi:hypothetical protein
MTRAGYEAYLSHRQQVRETQAGSSMQWWTPAVQLVMCADYLDLPGLARIAGTRLATAFQTGLIFFFFNYYNFFRFVLFCSLCIESSFLLLFCFQMPSLSSTCSQLVRISRCRFCRRCPPMNSSI